MLDLEVLFIHLLRRLEQAKEDLPVVLLESLAGDGLEDGKRVEVLLDRLRKKQNHGVALLPFDLAVRFLSTEHNCFSPSDRDPFTYHSGLSR